MEHNSRGGGPEGGEKHGAIKKKEMLKDTYVIQKARQNTYFLKKNGSEHFFRRKHWGANQAL